MLNSYFLCSDLFSLEKDWQSSLDEVLSRLGSLQGNIKGGDWYQADGELIRDALIPQIKYMIQISNPKENLGNICKERVDYFVKNPRYREPRKKESFLSRFQKTTEIKAGPFSDLIRVVDIYKGLILVHQSGPVNQPISISIGNGFFTNYLKYIIGIKDYLRYDGSQRKNIKRELFPEQIDALSENFQYINHLDNRLCLPEELNSKTWMDRWNKLNIIPNLWDKISMFTKGLEGKAKIDMQFDIKFAEHKNREKYRIKDAEALVYRLLDKRRPKIPDLESEAYTEMAREHLRQIGNIARYALENNLALVRFYL